MNNKVVNIIHVHHLIIHIQPRHNCILHLISFCLHIEQPAKGIIVFSAVLNIVIIEVV